MPQAQPSKTRSHETAMEIQASPEAVWRAVTDATELVRWFAPTARVTPGEGGEIFVSWGPGMEGSARIAIWEPCHHLRTVEVRPGTATAASDAAIPVEIAVDYFIEANGGGTLLRLVHSGFGASAEWDREFDNTRYGWMMFLRTMRHALTRQAGVACTQATLFAKSSLDPASTWARVMGPGGLLASGSAEGLTEGSPFRWTAANGDQWSGIVNMFFPPTYIGGSLEQLHDSLFGITVMGRNVLVSLYLYGVEPAESEEFQARLQQILRTALA